MRGAQHERSRGAVAVKEIDLQHPFNFSKTAMHAGVKGHIEYKRMRKFGKPKRRACGVSDTCYIYIHHRKFTE